VGFVFNFDFVMQLSLILLQGLADGGAFYAETNPSAWLKEPWNAFSSLTFWIPIGYILYKIRGRYRQYPFLLFCMPLLFIGGLGSTLFHAFRSSGWLLAMDVLPILILNVALTIYFWFRILANIWKVLGVVLLYFVLSIVIIRFTEYPLSVNLSYLVRGILLFLPAVLLLQKMNFRHSQFLISAILLFILALVFRWADKLVIDYMSMGSHWLWHISTAMGALLLAEFMYRLENWEKQIKYI
jgi:hypothetical protein